MRKDIMAKEKEVQLKVRPLDDRVVVEPLEAEEKTAGGILLPDTAKQKPQRGRVLAVGPGKLRDSGERSAVAVSKGDEVLYGRYSGSDIEVDGREIKILRESDILARVVK
jgi:chaperonin GroES